MPRRDDEYDDDDRPRRRRRDEDDDDRPRRRSNEDDEFDDRPRRRRFDDEDDLPPRRKKGSNLGLILGIIGGVLLLVCGGGIGLLFYGCKQLSNKVGSTAEQLNSSNNLKEIGLGCHLYHDRYNAFPTNSYSPDGKALLSWRVHILPFIGEQGLYSQFKLDEPWDSANNIRLLNQMPMAYATPAERSGNSARGTKTYYRGFSSPGALFARRDQNRPAIGIKGGVNQPQMVMPPLGVRFAEISDGTANTILALEAGEAVEWTKPDDLDASPNKPFPLLGGARPNSDKIVVLFADGSTRFLRRDTSEAQWRAAITYAGNEVVILD